MSFRFNFFNNFSVTPIDYEPSGFKPCKFDEYSFKNKRTKEIGQVNLKWISFNLEVNIDEDFVEKADLFTAVNEPVGATLAKSEEKTKKSKTKVGIKEKKEDLADTSILRDDNLVEKIDKLSVNEIVVPEASRDESITDKKVLNCDCGAVRKNS